MSTEGTPAASSTRSLWPPAPLETGVKWLRGKPVLAVILVVLAVLTILALYTLKAEPLNFRLTAGSIALSITLILALPIYCEWQRQKNIERLQKVRVQQEQFNAAIADAQQHRQLLVNALGGEAYVRNLPRIAHSARHNLSDLQFSNEELSASAMQGSFSVKCPETENSAEMSYFVFKIREKNNPNRMKVCTIIQRKMARSDFSDGPPLFHCLGNGRYMLQGVLDRDYPQERPNAYEITDVTLNPQRKTLLVLGQIISGDHPTLELVPSC